MSYKEAINQLADLMTMAEFGVKNMCVIQSAMAEEATDLKNGACALFCTYEYLKDLHDQMNAIVEQAIRANREQTAEREAAA